jgi:hypothetical protein
MDKKVIVIFVVFLFAFSLVSAVWWNPFSWGKSVSLSPEDSIFAGLPLDFVPKVGYSHPFSDGRINLWGEDGELYVYNGFNWFDRTSTITESGLPRGFKPVVGFWHPYGGDKGLINLFDDSGRLYYTLDGVKFSQMSPTHRNFANLPRERDKFKVPNVGYYDEINEKVVLIYENGEIYTRDSGAFVKDENYFYIQPKLSDDFHDADTNEDWKIDNSELLRVTQFFNSNAYHCEVGTEDGYAPGDGDINCEHHSADVNKNWKIDLPEISRIIQFFNSEGYYPCPNENSEDGFCVGVFDDSVIYGLPLDFVPKVGYYFDLGMNSVHLFGDGGELFVYSNLTGWVDRSSDLEKFKLPVGQIPNVGYYDKINEKAVLFYGSDKYVSDTGFGFHRILEYLKINLIFENENKLILEDIEKDSLGKYQGWINGDINESDVYEARFFNGGWKEVEKYSFDFRQKEILSNPPEECWTMYEGELIPDYDKCDLRMRESIIVSCDKDPFALFIRNKQTRKYVAIISLKDKC